MLIALNILLFSYLVWFRTAGLSQTFWIYADQIRDWQIALKPLTDLPLVGPPSLAGGNTAGPVYYWVLWAIARTLGPFMDYLPHAGGVGVAVLQTIGDCAMFSCAQPSPELALAGACDRSDDRQRASRRRTQRHDLESTGGDCDCEDRHGRRADARCRPPVAARAS